MIPPVYNTIYDHLRVLPERKLGWFDDARRAALSSILAYKDVLTAIELGTFYGESARFLAGADPSPEGRHYTARPVVYCVDSWSGPYGAPEAIDYADTAYLQFLSNLVHWKLVHRVVPVRMRSHEAAFALDLMADAIYIDAGHSAVDVYTDALLWSKHLHSHGVMFGDDWDRLPVQDGVNRAAKELGKSVHVVSGTTWAFRDPG